jgi:C-terminal processing protease CtpA/Prc
MGEFRVIWKKTFAVLFASVLLLVSSSAIAAKGKLGFGTEATISGFFNPVLRRVKITTVVPGSPAAAAGVMPGDYIVEANGRAIDGAPAREMAKQLKDIGPGAHLRLKLKRGEAFVMADIVAGA